MCGLKIEGLLYCSEVVLILRWSEYELISYNTGLVS